MPRGVKYNLKIKLSLRVGVNEYEEYENRNMKELQVLIYDRVLDLYGQELKLSNFTIHNIYKRNGGSQFSRSILDIAKVVK